MASRTFKAPIPIPIERDKPGPTPGIIEEIPCAKFNNPYPMFPWQISYIPVTELIPRPIKGTAFNTDDVTTSADYCPTTLIVYLTATVETCFATSDVASFVTAFTAY
jgi:hypothetical protein